MSFSQILFRTAAEAQRTCIGILGAGGKTTLMHTLGEELSKHHSPVILSSLTKASRSADHAVHFYLEFESEETRNELLVNNPLYIMGEIEDEQKLAGVDEGQLQSLYEASEVTIFECDGARKKSIKAHQPFDPVFPEFTTHGIIVVGADAVGARVDGKLVHRPELFREIWDVDVNYELEPAFIAKVLTSQYGYLQKVPKDVEFAYFVNKSDTFPDEAEQLAQALATVSRAAVYYGSIKKNILIKTL
ncbi:putative selenium-dependent hydroxylase accessory protein YqeC [bacterium]|nr:putative selenium-dependent hydroxylase accessory protein YqeC [bacterium]